MFINYYKLTEDAAIDGNLISTMSYIRDLERAYYGHSFFIRNIIDIITTVLNQPILTTNHIDVINYLLTLLPEHELKKISELLDNSIIICKQNNTMVKNKQLIAKTLSMILPRHLIRTITVYL
jgi:hypothetical protein